MLKIPIYLSLIAVIVLTSCKETSNSAKTDPTPEEVIENKNFGGVALYTLREELATEPQKTLMQASKIGYQYVEAAGYEKGKFYGMSPEEFKDYMNSIDLEPRSSHMSMATLDNIDTLIQDVKNAGFKYFVMPIPPMGHFQVNIETKVMSMDSEVEVVTEILNIMGEKCFNAGLEFLYHNHNFEFVPNENGIVPMDYFLANTNPKYVNFEMDLYWVTKAGADPLTYFEKYPGRFKAWHIKDMDDQGRFAPVGTGSIDFNRILAKKELSGMECYFVEQDATFDGLAPIEAVTISHEAIKNIGFE